MGDVDVQLGEIINFANGKSRPSDSVSHDFPVYGANGVIGYTSKQNVEPHATVIGRVGSYCGVVHYSKDACWVTDNAIIARAKSGNDAHFIYYLLRNLQLHKYRIGSGQPLLTQGILGQIKVRHRTLFEQIAIAVVLGALDDKIAVNERIVSVTDDLLAALLDDTMADDVDTVDVPLAKIASVNVRTVRPTNGGHLRYIDISSVSPGRFDWPGRISWADAPGRARRGVSPGDTVWSTVRPGRRSHALVLDDDPELVASTGLAVLTPTEVGPAFLYEVTGRDEFVHYLESVAEGSAYPAVRAERFNEALVPMPSKPRLTCFEEQAMALRKRAHAASHESRKLTELRDTLLPKLMSGELRVREAEGIVGGVL